MTQPRKNNTLRNPIAKVARDLEAGDSLQTHPGVFWDVVSVGKNRANAKTLRVELVHGQHVLLGPDAIVTVLK